MKEKKLDCFWCDGESCVNIESCGYSNPVYYARCESCEAAGVECGTPEEAEQAWTVISNNVACGKRTAHLVDLARNGEVIVYNDADGAAVGLEIVIELNRVTEERDAAVELLREVMEGR